MIQMASSIAGNGRRVVEKRGDVMRLTDSFRNEAAREFAIAMQGVTVKKVRAAGVPGAGAAFLSRCQHGDYCNPVYRLCSVFILGRMLGIPKSAFQRILDLLQSKLDAAYADKPVPTVKEALEADSAIDPQDDHARYLASQGCPAALSQLLEVKRHQLAHLPCVIRALEAAR